MASFYHGAPVMDHASPRRAVFHCNFLLFMLQVFGSRELLCRIAPLLSSITTHSDIPTCNQNHADSLCHLENWMFEPCVGLLVGIYACLSGLESQTPADVTWWRLWVCVYTVFTCYKSTIHAPICPVCFATDDFPMLLSHQWLRSLVVFSKYIIFRSN